MVHMPCWWGQSSKMLLRTLLTLSRGCWVKAVCTELTPALLCLSTVPWWTRAPGPKALKSPLHRVRPKTAATGAMWSRTAEMVCPNLPICNVFYSFTTKQVNSCGVSQELYFLSSFFVSGHHLILMLGLEVQKWEWERHFCSAALELWCISDTTYGTGDGMAHNTPGQKQ